MRPHSSDGIPSDGARASDLAAARYQRTHRPDGAGPTLCIRLEPGDRKALDSWAAKIVTDDRGVYSLPYNCRGTSGVARLALLRLVAKGRLP